MGKAPATADGGSAPANTPVRIETLDDAATNFARRHHGNVVRNALYNSLELAFLQDPRPAKVYGSRSPATTTPPRSAAWRPPTT